MAQYDTTFAAVDANTVRALGAAASEKPDISGIIKSESANFNTAFNGAEGSGQDVLTYGSLISRNISVRNIAKQMTDQNYKVLHGPKDTYTRQGEINEWQAQNKLDTLFFLQITFLFFTLTVILIFLNQWGALPSQVVSLIIGILVVVVIGVLWNRASYTAQTRDKRYWNRRYIGLDSGITAASQCETPPLENE